MFEYWFHGLDDGDGPFMHHATTHDFLQVLADITKIHGPGICGEFVNGLMEDQLERLDYLRVIDWKFEFEMSSIQGQQKIVLHYMPR